MLVGKVTRSMYVGLWSILVAATAVCGLRESLIVAR